MAQVGYMTVERGQSDFIPLYVYNRNDDEGQTGGSLTVEINADNGAEGSFSSGANPTGVYELDPTDHPGVWIVNWEVIGPLMSGGSGAIHNIIVSAEHSVGNNRVLPVLVHITGDIAQSVLNVMQVK